MGCVGRTTKPLGGSRLTREGQSDLIDQSVQDRQATLSSNKLKTVDVFEGSGTASPWGDATELLTLSRLKHELSQGRRRMMPIRFKSAV